MKKIFIIFALLGLLLSGCVTSSTGGNAQAITSAVIRGAEIHVSDERSTIQSLIGKPDTLTDNQWYFKGRTKDEPTYILIFNGTTLQNIRKIEPKKSK